MYTQIPFGVARQKDCTSIRPLPFSNPSKQNQQYSQIPLELKSKFDYSTRRVIELLYL